MRTVVRALCLAVLAAGCAPTRTPSSSFTAAGLPCRELVDASGQAASAPIRWHQPPDEADRRRLDSRCARVGPAVLTAARPVEPRHDRPTPDGDLVVVSWNVHMGRGRLLELLQELRRGDLTGGANPSEFVLLLQEASRGSAAGDIVAVAAREGLSLLYVPAMRNGRDEEGAGDRGNAILSTLDLDDPTVVELPFVRQRRLAITAAVAFPTSGGPRLRVASAHFDASTSLRQLFLFTAVHRERQGRYLATVLDADQQPTVLGSDLNTWANGERERAHDVVEASLPEVTAGAPYARRFPLDYLFVRLPPSWRLESHAADTNYGSDHRPIVARIRLAS